MKLSSLLAAPTCPAEGVVAALAMCIFAAVSAGGGEASPPRPSTPIPGAELKTNEWVAVEQGSGGGFSFGGVVYLPGEKSWVAMMGHHGDWNDKGPFPYDEQTFTLEDRVWKNRFPPGKPWKPDVGVCDAPPARGWSQRGLVEDRMSLNRSGSYVPKAYFQYALDTDRNVVVACVRGATLEYDPAKRVWRDLKPENDPQAGHMALRWGSLCYDAHNREFVLFGGERGGSEFNDPRTWLYSPEKNAWRRLESENPLLDGWRAKAKALRLEGQRFYGACMARYFKTELPDEAKGVLGAVAKALVAKTDALAAELAGQGAGHEKTQCGWAAEAMKEAGALLARMGDVPDVESLKAGLAAKRELLKAEHTLLTEPPPRAHSQMVYDPGTKRIVLFGGDRLDMLYADTWVYDCAARRWEERRPELSPSPRAGHGFLYLPESKKLALVGGHAFDSQTGYWGAMYRQLPVEAWTYDVAGNRWRFVKEWPLSEKSKRGKPAGETPGFEHLLFGGKAQGLTLAVGEGDVLVHGGSTTYACKLDVSGTDAAGTAKRGVKPGAVEWRTGPYDPNWYLSGEAPAEVAFQATLDAVPANTWTVVTGKDAHLPRQNRDYGTAASAPDRDAFLWWSGGHSCHCGTDVPIFSMKTGRYYLLYAPGFPIENIGKSGGEPSNVNFLGQPWLPAHTYHCYAYDPISRKVVCCPSSRYYVFDPADGNWAQGKLPFRDSSLSLIVCSTPKGPYAWTTKAELYRYDGGQDTWSKAEVEGEKLHGTTCMNAGMCYDSKRNRLVMTHKGFKGDLMAVDLATNTARWLKPKGMAQVAGHMERETVYDASRDVVVVATEGKVWPVYDCARNAWVAVDVQGRNPTSVSLGLMHDPARQLLVAVNNNGHVSVLKLDMAKGKSLD